MKIEMYDKKKYDLYENMKKYFLSELCTLGRKKMYIKGSRLDADYFTNYYGILYSGSLKQYYLNEAGDDKLLFIYRPGEMIGEFINSGIEYKTFFEILSDSIIYLVDKTKIDLTPEFFEAYNISISRKYDILFLQSSSIYFDDPLKRLVNLILRTAYQCGSLTNDDEIEIDYKFSHEEMAKIIGTTRVTVTRKMTLLKELNAIKVVNKKIYITDVVKLQELVEPD